MGNAGTRATEGLQNKTSTPSSEVLLLLVAQPQNTQGRVVSTGFHETLSEPSYLSVKLTMPLSLSSESRAFPDGSAVTNPPADVGDPGSIPGLGRSPGEGNGTPLQYSCLENPMERGAWWATVHGVAKGSDTT